MQTNLFKVDNFVNSGNFPEDSIKCEKILEQNSKHQKKLFYIRNALKNNSESSEIWEEFSDLIENTNFIKTDNQLYGDLEKLLNKENINPDKVSLPIFSALFIHPIISKYIKKEYDEEIYTNLDFNNLAHDLSKVPLFLKLLEISTIRNLEVEKALTKIRFLMLQKLTNGYIKRKTLPFISALSIYCHNNNFVFFENELEKNSLRNIEKEILTNLSNNIFPEVLVTIFSCYRNLFQKKWIKKLININFSKKISQAMEVQIINRLRENEIGKKIPKLLPIVDCISSNVRSQYEDSPYPMWTKIDRRKNHFSNIKGLSNAEILVAGCGTGRQSIYTAVNNPKSRILAIDLSLNSLAYAKRKSDELEIYNIDYLHGDILDLKKLNRNFDFIESVGVIHHMNNPQLGLKVLVDSLNKKGNLRIGLYSKIARREISLLKSNLKLNIENISQNEIRYFRKHLIDRYSQYYKKYKSIYSSPDFFYLNGFRDLLFHQKEHQFTISTISSLLKKLELNFQGFELSKLNLQNFRNHFKETNDSFDFSLWETFEKKYPDTFSSMYVFWCNKIN